MELSKRDPSQITVYEHTEDFGGAKKVFITNWPGSFPEQKQHVSKPQLVPAPEVRTEYKTVEVPVIVKETEVVRVEVPVIQIEYREIEKPVVHEKVRYVEIPKIVTETKVIEVEKPVYTASHTPSHSVGGASPSEFTQKVLPKIIAVALVVQTLIQLTNLLRK